MDFQLDTFAPFSGFFVVIGKAPAGTSRALNFQEDVEPGRMTPRMIFCDQFDYLGVTVQPGMMTQDLPARPAGDNVMAPVATDRASYYLNAFRTGGFGYYDKAPVESNRVYLASGEQYSVERKQAVMLAVGAVRVKGPLTEREVSAPAIIDCRFGADQFAALSDVVLCEVWV